MKKLMIAAAIVCAAAVSQAAVCCWGFSNADSEDPTGGDYLYEGTAMLFKGTVEAIANGDGTYHLSFGENVSLVADPVGQNDNGTFGPVAYKNAVALPEGFKAAGGDAYSLLLFDKDGITAGDLANYEGSFFLANGTSAELQDQQSGNYYVAMVYKSAVRGGEGGGDWMTAANVPEPTSGLLLLLGVAGLALKRRRA